MKKISLILMMAFLLQACGQKSTAIVPSEVSETTAVQTENAVPIVHTIIPKQGLTPRSSAHDHEQSATFESKTVAAGDDFSRNQFERPFTAIEMTYLPDIDIVDFGITSDDQFFYIKIILAGLDPASQTVTGAYGVEIDRNADGRAEIMIAVTPPYSSDFTTDNVLVLVDRDGDIGGSFPSRPDEAFSGNGFDGVIFDLSQGIFPENDPDLAWVRVIEGDHPAIEIAYRKWIFKDGNESFMWSVWASGNNISPSDFNLHDALSKNKSGSPNKGDDNYPVQEFSAFDNTCRVPLGFDASGSEPLGCSVKVEGASSEGVAFCDQFGSVCERSPNLETTLSIEDLCFKACK